MRPYEGAVYRDERVLCIEMRQYCFFENASLGNELRVSCRICCDLSIDCSVLCKVCCLEE